MSEAVTVFYSELVRNQIEFNSTVEAILTTAKSVEVSGHQVGQVQEMLDAFNVRLNCLAIGLMKRFDDDGESTGGQGYSSKPL
ncbi:hypothetical protein NPS29_00930 [Pseudomonas putida]|uniref:hypothetical protein n=1 Tax=Pseudomonas putida TaxID=303 RepID=UPI0023647922|nr:hypothetical protein [Pseudomonas putida]MDD1963873.1 hypothetical protein [Pseudomonas putida]